MKIIMIAVLTIAPALLAQDGPQTRVVISQVGPLMSSGVEIVGGALIGGGTVQGAPYSAQAITESTQTLADGSHISHNSSSMQYRDSQGRERREMGPMVMISDPVSGSNFTLDPEKRTAHKMPTPQMGNRVAKGMVGGNVIFQSGVSVSGSLVTPPAEPHGVMIYKSFTGPTEEKLPAPTVEQLGSTSIEGILADGTRSTVTIPLGQAGNDRDLSIVTERWYSPDLKMTVLSKHTDPRTGTTEYRLTQINRSEPAASLFQVPADYTVVDDAAMFSEKIKVK
jgi:hypothetical protein